MPRKHGVLGVLAAWRPALSAMGRPIRPGWHRGCRCPAGSGRRERGAGAGREGSMARSALVERIERQLEQEAGLHVTVEETPDGVVLSGQVDTPDACAAATDIIARIAPGKRVDNNLTVETYVPQDAAEFNAQEP